MTSQNVSLIKFYELYLLSEMFSLKIYIGSAKRFDYCMLVCMFAHMYAFIWWETCKPPEHSRIEFQLERLKNGIT